MSQEYILFKHELGSKDAILMYFKTLQEAYMAMLKYKNDGDYYQIARVVEVEAVEKTVDKSE